MGTRRRRIIRAAVVALVAVGAVVAVVALTAAASRDEPAAKSSAKRTGGTCPREFKEGWQELANRIGAHVYCPGWVPAAIPIDAHHASVDPDGSYQVGFHDPEIRYGDIHAVVACYPGSQFPRCTDLATRKREPCASKPTARKQVGGFSVTLYEEVWGHESNHLLYAWTDGGSLYTVSVHQDPPHITREMTLQQLDRIMRSLERIEPTGEPASHDGGDE